MAHRNIDRIIISPPTVPISTVVQLPTSKSISNRALIMAALSGSRDCLIGLSDDGDTRILDHLLTERPLRMDCGSGGTTLRFVLAWAAMQEGEERIITGTQRLIERPHDELVAALNSIGASIERMPGGFRVIGKKLKGGKVDLFAPKSSQYISALLMIGPFLENGIQIHRHGDRSSEPYIRMTCSMMQQFGAEVKLHDDLITVHPGKYSIDRLAIPRDWSAASFWYQIAALSPGAIIELEGLADDGLQGDARAEQLWEHWVISDRTERGTVIQHRTPSVNEGTFKFDLKQIPDLFQPLSLTCAATGVKAEFSGLESLPLKETDRIQATAKMLKDFGGGLESSGAKWIVLPMDLEHRSHLQIPIIDPEDDHRMAMSAALLSLVVGPVQIMDPQVVSKSYPLFWDHLRSAGFTITAMD